VFSSGVGEIYFIHCQTQVERNRISVLETFSVDRINNIFLNEKGTLYFAVYDGQEH
jgi:hypothetical protein